MKPALIFIIFLFLISCQQGKKQKTVKQLPAETELGLEEDEIVGFGQIQKAEISKKDSVFWVIANINFDYQIFGYERPDTSSRKLIVFSVFTNDVEDNPYQCPLGAYYGTHGLEDSHIKYKGEIASFIIADFIQDEKTTSLYFDKSSVEFVE